MHVPFVRFFLSFLFIIVIIIIVIYFSRLVVRRIAIVLLYIHAYGMAFALACISLGK